MERFIGLDAHVQSCTVAVMGRTGSGKKSYVVETQGRALLELIRSISGEKHLCLEEGKLSAWLYETLEPEVEEIVVCLPKPRRGNKSDAIDAWNLADDLRCNRIERPVYKSPRKFRLLREAVRAYETTGKDLGRAKNRLRSIYRERNVSAVNSEIYDQELGTDWLKKLPPAYRYRAEIFSDQLQAMTEAHEEATAWLEREAGKVPLVSLLATAPGIGTIRAAQIVATVITPHRFRTRQQFWSYCGLAIVTHSSSDWYIDSRGRRVPSKHTLTRGLNRQRNPRLKQVFKGAAQTVTTQMPSHPLYAAHLRLIEQGTRPNLARLTIARRIASAVLAMWKNDQEYDPGKHISASA
jgi:transposase